MNINWKSAFPVVVILLIGVITGAWLNRALVQNRIRGLLEMRGAGLLDPRPEKNLSLTPEREKQIREILDRHAERQGEIHERFRDEIRASFDALAKEVEPLLTPEQRERFRKMIPGPPPFGGRFPGFFPFRGRGDGPPPPGQRSAGIPLLGPAGPQ